MNNKGKILWGNIILILLLSAVLYLVITSFKQEIIYDSEISCDEIKNCIILEITCLDIIAKNSLLSFDWNITTTASRNNLKLIYTKECLTWKKQ